jgi:CHASE2 domain-containing sensor protein
MGRMRAAVWKSDWFLGLAVVAFVLVLHALTDAISGLERRFYDFGVASSTRVPSADVAIIAIDDASIARIGRWPWPRDVHARLIDQLAAGGAKTIVHTAFFFEPQTDRGLDQLRRIAQAVAADPELAPNATLAQAFREAEAALDTDGQLARSVAASGRTVLAAQLVPGLPLGRPDGSVPVEVLPSTLEDPGGVLPATSAAAWPLPALARGAAAIGHSNFIPDADGTVRSQALLLSHDGRALPSLPLAAVTRQINLRVPEIRLNTDDDSVQLGRLHVTTDGAAVMRPHFYASREGRPPFAGDSFHDVLAGTVPAAKYAGKLVLIGATAAGVGSLLPTPVSPAMPSVEALAHVSSSLLAQHFVTQPAWALAFSVGAVVAVAAYLLLVLPRLSAPVGAAVSLLVAATLLVLGYGLLTQTSVWVQAVLPVVVLVMGHLALTTRRFLITEAGKEEADARSAESFRMLGLALQGQGQLDMAWDKFRRVPMDARHGPELMDNLYNLALDFERKRQFNKAQAIYEHMAGFDEGYKDLKTKLKRAKNLSDSMIIGSGAGGPAVPPTLKADGEVEKPMLGRYRVEKEIGRGAMGAVYLGRDPKIGRLVAIKTMALGQEFEGAELKDARARFFREAETAGRLQHPDIVTIFDAGEEHDLAYIAMEFLKGHDLSAYSNPARLLPVPVALRIIARVADALAYAHSQGVAHRDIKPSNIMVDIGADTVKVTDFGIARITDSSKTKTGVVLGTPSFMSPEQMSGRRIDGRSDLYSLGVTLFQLLCGRLPFRGDSMAALMYAIANEPAPDIRTIKPELPEALANVVALALEKRPEMRYGDGRQFAADLRAVATTLDSQRTAPLPRPAEELTQPVAPSGMEPTLKLPTRTDLEGGASADPVQNAPR